MAEVIVALDFDSRARALEMVDTLGTDARWYKVGLELFTRTGPDIVEELRDAGKSVFLDLKLHDIPSTVAGAVRSVAGTGAKLLTVHATGGTAMLSAAVEAAGDRMDIVAVTLLTSLSGEDAAAVFGTTVREPRAEVLRLAALARGAGVAGVVCSAREAAAVRANTGPDFTLVTPGIRLAGGTAHDQARVMTPSAAAAAGADYLVVGRTVTRADDPARTLARVVAEAVGPEVTAS